MYHTIIAVGNLGRDPEMRYTPEGQAVTNFSVACNRQYKGKDGRLIKETIWFRVSTWGNTAENCNKYLKRGSKVLVEGRLIPDFNTGGPKIWNRQDGTPAASFEINALTVRFLSSRSEDDASAPEQDHEEPEQDATDDIPF